VVIGGQLEVHDVLAEPIKERRALSADGGEDGRQLQELIAVLEVGEVEEHGAVAGALDGQTERLALRGHGHHELGRRRVVAARLAGVGVVAAARLRVGQNRLRDLKSRIISVCDLEVDAARSPMTPLNQRRQHHQISSIADDPPRTIMVSDLDQIVVSCVHGFLFCAAGSSSPHSTGRRNWSRFQS